MCKSWWGYFLDVASVLAMMGAVWAAQPTPEISFTGRVLDSQGKPVPDAQVTFCLLYYAGPGALPRVERVKEIATGSDGAFVFTTARESAIYRSGSIVAQKEGFALGWAHWSIREGPQQSDIVLGEPRELSGSVVDEGDSPVIDAQVSIAVAALGSGQDYRSLMFYVASEFLTVRTDSTGRFAFSNMPARAACELLARKPGRATICTYDPLTYSGEKYRFSPGQAGIKLTLPAEARIEGTVAEKAGGKPLGGVPVIAQPIQRGLPSLYEPATSSPDGAFSIGALPAGGYTVILVPPTKGIAEWVAEPVKVDLKASETLRGIGVQLTKGGLVEVRVKEDTAGKPVEKASVDIRDPSYSQLYGGMTDETGLIRARLAPGNYEISGAFKQGYMRSNQSETFSIGEGETRTFEQTLSRPPSAGGVVYDEAGKPLEGVTVRVVPGGGSSSETVSDAQGRFQVSWDTQNPPRPQSVFYIVARHSQRNLAVAQPLEEPGNRVEVRLRPGTIVTGQVVDPNGKGIEGAEIIMMLRAAMWGSTFMPYRGIKTDAQGRYEIPAIPSGQQYTINISANRYGQAQAELKAEEVTGQRVQAGTCTLALANLSVSGVVVDSWGKPMPNVSVSCFGGFQGSQPDRRARTDLGGKFVLVGVCAGPIQIQANTRVGESNVNGSVQTEGGATGVRITMSERRVAARYVPPSPAALKGKPLPDLKKLGIELPAETQGKVLLVCFWDMNQRPSRYCIGELIRRAPQMADKGVTIVAIHAGQTEEGALEQWVEKNKPPFPAGRITRDIEKTQFEWGAASLPHLILTDRNHVVIGEGFGLLGELDKRIEAASGR